MPFTETITIPWFQQFRSHWFLVPNLASWPPRCVERWFYRVQRRTMALLRSIMPNVVSNFPYLDKFENQNLSLFRGPLIKWVPNHDLIRFNLSLIADYSLKLTTAHWTIVECSFLSVQYRMLAFLHSTMTIFCHQLSFFRRIQNLNIYLL